MHKSTATYFEQIPIATVKKLVEDPPGRKEMNGDRADRFETPEESAAVLRSQEHLHCRMRILQ